MHTAVQSCRYPPSSSGEGGSEGVSPKGRVGALRVLCQLGPALGALDEALGEASVVGPVELEPAPAVQPKQCGRVTTWRAWAKKSASDYSFHVAVTWWSDQWSRQNSLSGGSAQSGIGVPRAPAHHSCRRHADARTSPAGPRGSPSGTNDPQITRFL